MFARVLLAVLCLFLACDCVVAAGEEAFAEIYAELSLPMPTPNVVVVCHGFNCRNHTEIVLTPADRRQLGTLLAGGKDDPVTERRGIATAVRWFDRRIGPAAGTTKRVARAAAAESSDPGQMDCIDITSNNTSLFLLLAQLRLLHHHRAELPVSRGYLIDTRMPHTTAVLDEFKAGRKWAVDNWTYDYGALPDIMPLEKWRTQR